MRVRRGNVTVDISFVRIYVCAHSQWFLYIAVGGRITSTELVNVLNWIANKLNENFAVNRGRKKTLWLRFENFDIKSLLSSLPVYFGNIDKMLSILGQVCWSLNEFWIEKIRWIFFIMTWVQSSSCLLLAPIGNRNLAIAYFWDPFTKCQKRPE